MNFRPRPREAAVIGRCSLEGSVRNEIELGLRTAAETTDLDVKGQPGQNFHLGLHLHGCGRLVFGRFGGGDRWHRGAEHNRNGASCDDGHPGYSIATHRDTFP